MVGDKEERDFELEGGRWDVEVKAEVMQWINWSEGEGLIWESKFYGGIVFDDQIDLGNSEVDDLRADEIRRANWWFTNVDE
ncbi:hypothetical protein BPOR_0283g00110 [Botrytis porri]|uniref:Uncharacterized protein n=1 Tax=Botrytis porri TaxID=87229 RepID=A0A4Z1KQB9_9HELO|nr:hypothetical protein BPOR_0283g00110 [Botrytis porri]